MDYMVQRSQGVRKRVCNEAQAHLKEVRARFIKTYINEKGKKKRT